MKSEVLAIVEELKRLRRAGVSHALVSDEALQALRSAGAARAQPAPEPTREEVLQSIPEKVRSASASEFDDLLKKPAAREASPAKSAAAPRRGGARLPPPTVSLPAGSKRARWEALREQVLACSVCRERAPEGSRVVVGVGDLDADLFLCDEPPRAGEGEDGGPFGGAAGELLGKMVEAAGLSRSAVYVAPAINWRLQAPNGASRPPTEEEAAFCLPYLRAQIEIVRPKVVLALGVAACRSLLGFGAFKNLRDIKGEWRDFEGAPVLPTYHPSYLLHNSSKRDKREAWVDWLKAMERAGLPISDRQRGFFL